MRIDDDELERADKPNSVPRGVAVISLRR